MILDIPPQTAQIIIAKAEQQGISVNDFLLQKIAEPDEIEGFDFIEKDGIYSTGTPKLSPEAFQAILDDLDAPPRPPTPAMQALMKKYGGLGVSN